MTGEVSGNQREAPGQVRRAAGGLKLNPLALAIRAALLVSIALLYAVRFPLAHRINVNWDEFHYLSGVHEYLQGRLATAIQSGHVHLFTWLAGLGPTEVEQIVAARHFYLVLAGVSALLLYAVARRFVSVDGALFVVLCFGAYSNLIVHGASFRADGLAVFLVILALYLLLGTDQTYPRLLGAGACVGGALLITLKVIFWLPTLIAAIWLNVEHGRKQLARARGLVSFLVASVLLYVVGFVAHQTAVDPETLSMTARRAGAAGTKVFTAGFLPQPHYFVLTIARNPYIWLCVVGGAYVVYSLYRRGELSGSRAWSFWLLLLPCASVLVYRNAFPYFYVFIVPPALLLAGWFWDWVWQEICGRERLWTRAIQFVLLAAVASSGIVHVLESREDRTQTQRQVLRVVHRLFPEPVPYIDRAGMVASFPKVGFFMSSWGLENYRERGEPVFEELLREHQPAFILENTPLLDLAPDAVELPPPYRLFPEDRRILQENYERLWGPLFVPGKRFTSAAPETRSFNLLIGGAYVVHSASPILIGKKYLAGGDTIMLSPGAHTLQSASTILNVRLLSAASQNVALPDPPTDQLFIGF